jgi:ApbE superfamily uncharacterized protein (UPF0280 family)
MLPDGRRLHLQHGPIDLVIDASGPRDEVAAAYRQAIKRFRTVLAELVDELRDLRKPAGPELSEADFRSPAARRMARAVRAHAGTFITPMAAVAGAVADEILAAMRDGRELTRAYVNNGGDIALHLAPGESYAAGLVSRPDDPRPAGKCTVTHDMPVRGIATSGRSGRSFSLGIADAVTVLAHNAAAADAAATLIANAVTVDHPSIRRAAAETLDPDGDLGKLLVTTAVGPLDDDAVSAALAGGVATATRMAGSGVVHGAVLCLNERYRVVGADLSGALPAVKQARENASLQSHQVLNERDQKHRRSEDRGSPNDGQVPLDAAASGR